MITVEAHEANCRMAKIIIIAVLHYCDRGMIKNVDVRTTHRGISPHDTGAQHDPTRTSCWALTLLRTHGQLMMNEKLTGTCANLFDCILLP